MRWLLLFATACSFPGADSKKPAGDHDAPPGADAPDDAAVAADAPPDGASADCFGKWLDGTVQLSNPVRLAVSQATFNDRDPYISADGLSLFFTSDRPTSQGVDVWVARRASATGTFANPQRRADVDSTNDDSKFSMDGTQLIAVVASDRAGTTGSLDLFYGTRASTADNFSFGKANTAPLDDANPQFDPELSASGLHLYFSIGSPQRIVMSARPTTNDTFITSSDLINGGSGDADPALSPDERLILFSSQRNAGGVGGVNIWFATRPDANAAFGTPALLPVVNGNASDGDPTLSSDGCHLIFSSNRTGDFDLYQSDVQ